MSIDWSKQVQTRGGKRVRIYARDGGGQFPIHGSVLRDDGWRQQYWMEDGKYCPGGLSPHEDLVNVQTKFMVERWVNVYPRSEATFHASRDAADRYSNGRIACKRIAIEVEEGEGL